MTDVDPLYDALVRSGPGEHSYGPEELVQALLSRPKWQREAACRGEDPDLFFPARGASMDPARAICARCPVTTECLEAALATGERFGVWGGTSERQRRQIRGIAA